MKFFLTICYIEIFFVSFTNNLFAKNDSAILIKNNIDTYPLKGFLLAYPEKYIIQNIHHVIQFYKAEKFQEVKYSNNSPNINGQLASGWFALSIQNTTLNSKYFILNFLSSSIYPPQIYIVEQLGLISLINPENFLSQSAKSFLNKNFIYTFKFEANARKLIFIHVSNERSNTFFPVNLIEKTKYDDDQLEKISIIGIYQGILFFIILFILFVFFTTKDKIYAYYLFYVGLISLFALDQLGLTFTILFPVSTYLFFLSGPLLLLFGSAAWLSVILLFLNLTQKNFLYYKMYKYLININIFFGLLGCLLNILFTIFHVKIFQNSDYFLNAVIILNLLAIFFTVISRVVKRDKLALFYLCCNFPLVAGFALYYFNQIGWTNFQILWSNPIVLGVTIETFLLSFGFAYRFNLFKLDKEKLLIKLHEQQKSNATQVIKIQENDRERIARDLHDDLGGSLASIKMIIQSLKVDNLKIANKIILLIDKASENARNIAHNLMPPEFDRTALSSLLQTFFATINNEKKICFHFFNKGEENPFNKQDKLMIYRIIMELSSNIIKHADATEATIQFIYFDSFLEIMSEDNGKGFFPNSHSGMGLNNIKSRVSYLNGTIHIDSNKNGTTFIIKIPF